MTVCDSWQFWGMGDGEGGGGGGDVEGIETRREAAGVPRTGALLCFFNQHFKLDPDTFAVWTGTPPPPRARAAPCGLR